MMQSQHTLIIDPGTVFFNRYEVKQPVTISENLYLATNTFIKKEIFLKVLFPDCVNAGYSIGQLIDDFSSRAVIHGNEHILKTESPFAADYYGTNLIIIPIEYADGGTLRDWIKHHQEDLKKGYATEIHGKALGYFKQACTGVKAMHEAGLCHLALKPENLFIVNDKIKVGDIGFNGSSQYQISTSPDIESKNSCYLSPEQIKSARPKDISKPSDIYSLGVILFELLDGHPPSFGGNETIAAKLFETAPHLKENIPEYLKKVLIKSLCKNPRDRFQNLQSLLDRFENKKRSASGALKKERTLKKIKDALNFFEINRAQKLKEKISEQLSEEDQEEIDTLFDLAEDEEIIISRHLKKVSAKITPSS